MNDTSLHVLAAVGVLFLLLIFVTFGISLYYIIKESIARKFQKYVIKRRFKKKPTAKCYCRDCKQWDPATGQCYDLCNSRLMGPSWFCCFAEPLVGKNFDIREKYIKEQEEKE